eukprot:m.197139 g.197139  ORF g.197139 m.197139 type:complete len:62 (+) comp13680_c0_seq34:111-296(+)
MSILKTPNLLLSLMCLVKQNDEDLSACACVHARKSKTTCMRDDDCNDNTQKDTAPTQNSHK